MALNTAQQVIERSLFEVVYQKTLAEGYTANLDDLPAGPEGKVEYEKRLEIVKAAKGFAIEIFNYSPADDKGLKQVPRIVLATDSFLPGDYGIDPSPQPVYNTGNDNYDMQVGDSMSYNMMMSCCVVANSTAELRTLIAIVNKAIPLRGFIPYELDPTSFFLTILDSFDDLGTTKEGIIEKIYRYSIPDVVWTEPTNKAEVSKLESYELDIIKLGLLGLFQ